MTVGSFIDRLPPGVHMQRNVEGTVIESSKSKYVIIKLLGAGGFGAVYRVHDQKDPTKMFALKVEKKIETRKHSKLKMEIAILKLVSNERNQSHFTAIIDRGKKETYFFLVMELVGKSLADLKNARPERIYILDFGIARRILNDKNELKTPRVSVRFKGTIPFASIACHKGIEMGPKDDCESWFYLMLDLTVPGG
ncbi:Tau-tubulin kinase 1 [Trichostrongylus colubriformis]|uniref:Tau-tubulin kinase 1 n=1 Tax=Trichostrongylus colubriformis TaxID=6319 RepID=A0AAN8ENS9_TRICO